LSSLSEKQKRRHPDVRNGSKKDVRRFQIISSSLTYQAQMSASSKWISPALGAVMLGAVYMAFPGTGSARSEVHYPNCAAARAAGAAPVRRGEPGYRPELDLNGDGIACEPNPRR
jgi:hypothetical protein